MKPYRNDAKNLRKCYNARTDPGDPGDDPGDPETRILTAWPDLAQAMISSGLGDQAMILSTVQ